MFEIKELAWILVALAIFEFLIIFPLTTYNPFILLTPVIILAVNLLVKKVAAGFFNIKINYKIFEIQRYGFPERSKLRKPFPVGLVIPFVISFLSLGALKIFLFLEFEVKNLSNKRLLKARGIERRNEINDSDAAFTAFWGFFSLIILSIFATLPFVTPIFPYLPRYAVFYGLWNLLPIGNLDGARLFFGSRVTWFITAIMFLIGLFFVFFV